MNHQQGTIITTKLSGKKGIILKELTDKALDALDPAIGKKFLVRQEDGKLVALYDCEFEVRVPAAATT
jgi:hypothetical protein